MVIAIIIISIVVPTTLFYLSWKIELGAYIRCVCSRPEVSDAIALSYDDGVDPQLTPALLDLLEQSGAKATFCIIGDKALKYPDIVRDIAAKGHTIVNHSMHHRGTFPMQSTKSMVAEIERCSATLEAITAERVAYFRPPFGVTNPMVARAIKQSGLIGLGWNIRSYDTLGHSVERVTKRVISRIKGGDIILLHDNRETVIEITQRLLTYFNDNGLRAISVEQLLR